MTTIACDGLGMAGDGQAEANEAVLSRTRPKVRKLSDGSLFGGAGPATELDLLAQWLIEGGKKPKLEKLTALRLMPDGKLIYFTEKCQPIEIDAPCAVGSGGEFAMGAMDAGATPQEAVEIASDRDPHTGGVITYLELPATQK